MSENYKEAFEKTKKAGEIAAGAGTGTSGSSITFSIRENNYVGEGKRLNANVTISDDKFTGIFK